MGVLFFLVLAFGCRASATGLMRGKKNETELFKHDPDLIWPREQGDVFALPVSVSGSKHGSSPHPHCPTP